LGGVKSEKVQQLLRCRRYCGQTPELHVRGHVRCLSWKNF